MLGPKSNRRSSIQSDGKHNSTDWPWSETKSVFTLGVWHGIRLMRGSTPNFDERSRPVSGWRRRSCCRGGRCRRCGGGWGRSGGRWDAGCPRCPGCSRWRRCCGCPGGRKRSMRRGYDGLHDGLGPTARQLDQRDDTGYRNSDVSYNLSAGRILAHKTPPTKVNQLIFRVPYVRFVQEFNLILGVFSGIGTGWQ